MTNDASWKADVKYLLMYLVSIFRSVYKVRGQMEMPSELHERSIPRSIEDFLKDLDSRLTQDDTSD